MKSVTFAVEFQATNKSEAYEIVDLIFSRSKVQPTRFSIRSDGEIEETDQSIARSEFPSSDSDSNSRSPRLLYKVSEIAEALAISRSKVYELFYSGELTPIRIGKSVRVRAEELDLMIRRYLDKE